MENLINCFKELKEYKATDALTKYFEKDIVELLSGTDLNTLTTCLLEIFEDFLKRFVSNTAQDKDIKLLNSCCSLLQAIIEIHSEKDVIFKITDLIIKLVSMINYSNSNLSLVEFKDNILILGFLWILKRHYKYEKLVVPILFGYMNKCLKLGAKVLDYQHLCELRDTLTKLDITLTQDQIKLIKNCFSNEQLLSSTNGKFFLSALLSWQIDVTLQCHETIKQNFMNADIPKIKSYSEIYYLAWARPLQLSPAVIEMECLEYLVYGALHVSRKVKKLSNKPFSASNNIPLHHKLRILIHSILKKRRTLKSISENMLEDDILTPSLSTKLLDPILWKSLTVPNQDVRLNAAYIFFDTFPILDQAQCDDANVLAPKLLKQYDLIKDLLKDPHHMVRLVAITGTCKIMAHHWNAIPSSIAYSFLKYIIKVCVWDIKFLENRIIALNGLTYLLIKNAGSHRMLKMLLPSVEAIILENSEKLKLTLINLLFAIKNSPNEHNLKFWDVVQIPLLVQQLGIEHEAKKVTSGIVQRLAQLLYPTFLRTREMNEPLLRELVERCIALNDINHENALIFYKECSDSSSFSLDDKLRTINVYWTCIHQICLNISLDGSSLEKLYEMEQMNEPEYNEPDEELEEGEVVIDQNISTDDSLPYNNLKVLHHLLAPTQILLTSLEAKVNQMQSIENQLTTEHKREFDSEILDFTQKLNELHFYMAQTFNTIFEVLDNTSLLIILIMIAGYLPMELIPDARTRIYEKLLEEKNTKSESHRSLLDQCIILTFYHWGDSTSIFKHAHLFLDKHTSISTQSSPSPNKNYKRKKKDVVPFQPPPDLGLTVRVITQFQHLVTYIIAYDDPTNLDPNVVGELERSIDYFSQIIKSFIEASEWDQSTSPSFYTNPRIMEIVYETYLKILLYQHVAQMSASAVEITAVYPFAQLEGRVKSGKKNGRGSVKKEEVRDNKLMDKFVYTFVQLTDRHFSLIKMLGVQEGDRGEEAIIEVTTACLRVISDALALNVLNRPQFEDFCLVLYNLYSDIAWGYFPQPLITLIHGMFRYCIRIWKALDTATYDSDKAGNIAEGDSCPSVQKGNRGKKGGKTNVDYFFSTKFHDFRIMRRWVLNLYVHMIEACCYRSQLLPQPSSEQLTDENYHENLIFYPLWRDIQQSCPDNDMMDSVLELTFDFVSVYLFQHYRPRYPNLRADSNYLQIYTFPYLLLQYFSCLSKPPFFTLFLGGCLKAIPSESVPFDLESIYTVLVVTQILVANFKTKLNVTEKQELTNGIERRLMTTTLQDSQLYEEIKLMLIEI